MITFISLIIYIFNYLKNFQVPLTFFNGSYIKLACADLLQLRLQPLLQYHLLLQMLSASLK